MFQSKLHEEPNISKKILFRAKREFKEEMCTNKSELAPGMSKVCKKGCMFDRPEAGLIQVSSQ